MLKLIIVFILNIIIPTYQCNIINENINNIPNSTFRILNDCDKQRNFYYTESIRPDILFILDKYKWKDFHYINQFSKNNGMIFRYEKSTDATLFEANYDTFPIGNSTDGLFYDISVIPPDCGTNNWNKCTGNKLGYNVPISVEIITDLKNIGGNCKNIECNKPQCDMGMKWPSDYSNVFACPGSVSFIIKFGC